MGRTGHVSFRVRGREFTASLSPNRGLGVRVFAVDLDRVPPELHPDLEEFAEGSGNRLIRPEVRGRVYRYLAQGIEDWGRKGTDPPSLFKVNEPTP